jgi:hypothetical protein
MVNTDFKQSFQVGYTADVRNGYIKMKMNLIKIRNENEYAQVNDLKSAIFFSMLPLKMK